MTTLAATRFYLPSEVARHNTLDDCWISVLGKVFDLSKLLTQSKGLPFAFCFDQADDPLAAPLIRYAGNDLSHWFDADTKDVKTCVDPESGLRVPFLPHGRFLHIPPNYPSNEWASNFVPWWIDLHTYVIGNLSLEHGYIRIINTLTSQSHIFEVCGEENLGSIQNRFLSLNANAEHYVWKRLGKVLDMKKTLIENGVHYAKDDLHQVLVGKGENDDLYIPAIHLYFNDDI